jgi:peroxiredoxin
MKTAYLLVFLFILSFVSTAQQPGGLLVGAAAPDFTLKDQSGSSFTLKNENAAKTVIVIFYRGQWCPYCSKQLKGLNDSMQLIANKGATIVAVTPETNENIAKTIEKTSAAFPILTDENLKVMTAYKVAFAVDAETIERYKKYGINFDKANGMNGANLPVPAVYIIKNGVITWRYFDTDYRKRPSVKELSEQL